MDGELRRDDPGLPVLAAMQVGSRRAARECSPSLLGPWTPSSNIGIRHHVASTPASSHRGWSGARSSAAASFRFKMRSRTSDTDASALPEHFEQSANLATTGRSPAPATRRLAPDGQPRPRSGSPRPRRPGSVNIRIAGQPLWRRSPRLRRSPGLYRAASDGRRKGFDADERRFKELDATAARFAVAPRRIRSTAADDPPEVVRLAATRWSRRSTT